MSFQTIFSIVMCSLIGILLLLATIRLIHDKIKYGVFFEDDRNDVKEQQSEVKE